MAVSTVTDWPDGKEPTMEHIRPPQDKVQILKYKHLKEYFDLFPQNVSEILTYY